MKKKQVKPNEEDTFLTPGDRKGEHNYMKWLESKGDLPGPKKSDSQMYDELLDQQIKDAESKEDKKK